MVWTLHSPRASSLRMDCSDGGHVERHGSGQARWRSGAGGQGSRQGSRPHPGTYLRRSTTSGRTVREDREVSYYVEVQCTWAKYRGFYPLILVHCVFTPSRDQGQQPTKRDNHSGRDANSGTHILQKCPPSLRLGSNCTTTNPTLTTSE